MTANLPKSYDPKYKQLNDNIEKAMELVRQAQQALSDRMCADSPIQPGDYVRDRAGRIALISNITGGSSVTLIGKFLKKNKEPSATEHRLYTHEDWEKITDQQELYLLKIFKEVKNDESNGNNGN